MTEWKAYAEYKFNVDGIAIHMAQGRNVVGPMGLLMTTMPEGTETPPAMVIPGQLARSLFDALGRVLGVYTPDAQMAQEVLAREADRVDRMVNYLIWRPRD